MKKRKNRGKKKEKSSPKKQCDCGALHSIEKLKAYMDFATKLKIAQEERKKKMQ